MQSEEAFELFAAEIARENPELTEEQISLYAAKLGDIVPDNVPGTDLVIVRDNGREIARIHLPENAS